MLQKCKEFTVPNNKKVDCYVSTSESSNQLAAPLHSINNCINNYRDLPASCISITGSIGEYYARRIHHHMYLITDE